MSSASSPEQRKVASQLYDEARLAMTNGQWQEAVNKLEQVLDISPDFPGAEARHAEAARWYRVHTLYEMGRTRMRAGLWSNALKAFKQAQELETEYKDLSLLIRICERQLAHAHDQPTRVSNLRVATAIAAIFVCAAGGIFTSGLLNFGTGTPVAQLTVTPSVQVAVQVGTPTALSPTPTLPNPTIAPPPTSSASPTIHSVTQTAPPPTATRTNTPRPPAVTPTRTPTRPATSTPIPNVTVSITPSPAQTVVVLVTPPVDTTPTVTATLNTPATPTPLTPTINTATPLPTATATLTATTTATPAPRATPRTINLTSTDSSLEPRSFTLTAGESLRIRLTNQGTVTHTWILRNSSGATLARVEASANNSNTSTEFIAPVAGNYTYVFILSNRQDPELTGTIIIR
jgi:plastocyanin